MEVVAPSWREKDSKLGKVGPGCLKERLEVRFVCSPALNAVSGFLYDAVGCSSCPCGWLATLPTGCTVDKSMLLRYSDGQKILSLPTHIYCTVGGDSIF